MKNVKSNNFVVADMVSANTITPTPPPPPPNDLASSRTALFLLYSADVSKRYTRNVRLSYNNVRLIAPLK